MIYLLNDHKAGFNIGNYLTSAINKINYPLIYENINHQLFTRDHPFFTTGNKKQTLIKQLLHNYPKIIKNAVFRRYSYLFSNIYNDKDKYIILVRDPREILISGYLYHLKCSEKWAISKNNFYYDFWKDYHFNKDEVKKYYKFIQFTHNFNKNETYQNKLKKFNQDDGILYELNNVAFLTFSGMINIDFINKKNVFILKFEDYQFNFDKTLLKFFDFLQIPELKRGLIKKDLYEYHTFENKNAIFHHKNFITNTEHITNRYEQYFSPKIENCFYKKYKDLLKKFNYI